MRNHRFSYQQKLDIVNYALETNQAQAARKFHVRPRTVCNWVHVKDKIEGHIILNTENKDYDGHTVKSKLSDLSIRSTDSTVLNYQDTDDHLVGIVDSDHQDSESFSSLRWVDSDTEFEEIGSRSRSRSDITKLSPSPQPVILESDESMNVLDGAEKVPVSNITKEIEWEKDDENEIPTQLIASNNNSIEFSQNREIQTKIVAQRNRIDLSHAEILASVLTDLDAICNQVGLIKDQSSLFLLLQSFSDLVHDFAAVGYAVWELVKHKQLEQKTVESLTALGELAENFQVLVKVTKPDVGNLDPSVSMMKNIISHAQRVSDYLLI